MFNLRLNRDQKFFCIGLNKTGTSSLAVSFKELGFKVGNEREAKGLFDAWASRDFKPIIKFCKSANVFQDSPFSFPYTFISLDIAFPGSKFILTIRDTPEQWFQSLVRFHGKKWANGKIPTKTDLQAATNVEKGRPWKVNRLLFNTPENDPYNKDILLSFYENHIQTVKDYFKTRNHDLLILNLAEDDSYRKFCRFINREPVRDHFPVINSSK